MHWEEGDKSFGILAGKRQWAYSDAGGKLIPREGTIDDSLARFSFQQNRPKTNDGKKERENAEEYSGHDKSLADGRFGNCFPRTNILGKCVKLN